MIQLEGGQVTLEPVEQLIARRDGLKTHLRDLGSQAVRLRQDAATKTRDAATFLVAQRSRWDTTGVADQLSEIDSLTTRIDLIDRHLAEVDAVSRHGFSGFFKRFGDRQRKVGLIKQRDQLAAQVNAALASIGAHAPAKTIPEADLLLGAVRQESNEAESLQKQTLEASTSVLALTREINARQEAIKKLGFDALWAAACLQNSEPPTIDSPVTLKRGEAAWISVGAVLSRQATRTQWTGRSQAISFPIGHTGIRYRVGSFRGHPIQTTMLKDLDAGQLVLTNQRLVFIGRLRSVTIGLPHIVHIEAYTDALGVFQDKRETPDFFKLEKPQYVLFYINYALSRLG